MKVISTRLHGVLDYGVGALFCALPWILRFNDNAPAKWTFVILGVGAIIYALLTKYELGLFRVLPLNVHLILDLLSGAFLMASPWLLGFADRIVGPHLVFGAVELIVVALTPWRFPRDTVAAEPSGTLTGT